MSGKQLQPLLEERANVRPHLAALLRYHGKAELFIVELEPDIFA